jgi:zinc transporter 1/2/3
MEEETVTTTEKDLLWFKLQAMAVIGAVAFGGGMVPLKKQSAALLSYGNAFSGGVFLAAGFLHMLGESVEGFESIENKGNFPYPYFFCVVGILIPLFVEKIWYKHDHSQIGSILTESTSGEGGAKKMLSTLMLVVTLSVHALIEGLALGVEDRISDATTILIAILAHKFFAGFALGVSLVKGNLTTRRVIQSVGLFAVTTPVGILLGLLLTSLFKGILHSIFSEAVTAIAAGTFIYVALFEVILEEFEDNHSHHAHGADVESHHGHRHEDKTEKYKKFGLLCVGILVMVIVSSFHGH